MKDKKLKLAEALREEKERLPERSIFGDLNNFKDYELAIKYLETGEYPGNYDEYDLLYACVEDFETICRDYDIE